MAARRSAAMTIAAVSTRLVPFESRGPDMPEADNFPQAPIARRSVWRVQAEGVRLGVGGGGLAAGGNLVFQRGGEIVGSPAFDRDGGALADNGMMSFRETLTRADAGAIRAWVGKGAQKFADNQRRQSRTIR